MSTHYRSIAPYLELLLRENGQEAILARLLPDTENLPRRIPGLGRISAKSVDLLWNAIGTDGERDAARATLRGTDTPDAMEAYEGNIENFIGTVKLPVGMAGPLRINGLFAQGDFHIPLATTEAALVASYHRGAQLLSEAGGCAAMLLSEGMNRAPGFAFADLREVGQFVAWALTSVDTFREKAEATTRYGKLHDMKVAVEGNHVYLDFEYTTGDASGQNMVTIATAAICEYIVDESPVKPRYHFIEANISGDKKASARSFLTVRGKKVTAEVLIPGKLIAKRLHTTAKEMEQYWRMSAIGGVMSGTIGIQGHYANGLTALYIACGQDAACIAESAVGVTRFEVVPSGELDTPDSLYASVTLPNLVVGTVGGGTGLPTQRACLDILGLAGPGNACALAEVCAALSLAGELSIIGALAAGDFASAHQRLARSRVKETTPEPDHDHAG
ncbi:MAG: hydroxymethylglutaryl-CoA reductase [Akkermansiaceae bacterium]|nr:hydroxymethylglutaryl-CoA reductase [Armatimonadota bacterium]